MEFYSARCFVRPFKEEDIPALMAYRNHEEWMQYQGFKGLTLAAYRESLLGEKSLETGRQLAVVSRDSGHLIGDIYLRKEGTTFWIGYTVAPENARQGYASEVVLALAERLKKEGATQLKAGVLPDNLPSVELLKKTGFIFSHKEEGEDVYTLSLH